MAKYKKARRSDLAKRTFTLPIARSKLCPLGLLKLDLENPRLQTGTDISPKNEDELLVVLADIAALDELVTSIVTNAYLNLEPLIVIGESDSGPFRVLEGNRRLAAVKIIRDERLARSLGIRLPGPVRTEVLESTAQLLVYRVRRAEDAREFIGFKHINGPQRWDAYAKARYVTDWYKNAKGAVGIAEIAARMGDNNNTLRSYVYSVLILEQAEDAGVWSIRDRANAGRFAFSHLYTALSRKEYQTYLRLTERPDNPPIQPIDDQSIDRLGEVLTYIYGSKSSDKPALVRSQNPDLKHLGEALVNASSYAVLANGGTLEEALDEIKDPSEAFQDALVSANLRMRRAITLMPKYKGGKGEIDKLVYELFDQAETLRMKVDKRRSSEN